MNLQNKTGLNCNDLSTVLSRRKKQASKENRQRDSCPHCPKVFAFVPEVSIQAAKDKNYELPSAAEVFLSKTKTKGCLMTVLVESSR